MKTVKCDQCNSVMGLARETPRWELYKCFSCRHVMGRIRKHVKQHEVGDATMEMDSCAGSLLDDEFRGMDPEEFKLLFEKSEGNKIFDEMVAKTRKKRKGRGASHDWLSALQSYEFATCQVVDLDGGRTCVECAGKYGIYRAFLDAHGEEFIFQWIARHQSIARLKKQERDDLVKRVAQSSSVVELDFKENMARVRVQHIGIPQDYYLAVEKSVREVDSVIPIVLSIFHNSS